MKKKLSPLQRKCSNILVDLHRKEKKEAKKFLSWITLFDILIVYEKPKYQKRNLYTEKLKKKKKRNNLSEKNTREEKEKVGL